MVSLLTLSQNIHSTPRLPVYTVITDLSDPELCTKAIYADAKTVSWLKWYMMKRTLELREQNRATLDREGDRKSRNRALLTGAVFRGVGEKSWATQVHT